MGSTASKSADKENKVNNHDKFVYDKTKIFFDEFGNIRYGGHDAAAHDREAEKTKIMKAELNIDDKTDGQSWYIVDSVWVEAWLHYVQIGDAYPRPGPCRNDRLIELMDVDDDTYKSMGIGSPISPNTVAETVSPHTGSPTPATSTTVPFGKKAGEPVVHAVWVAREGMQMAVRSRKGDYRRVTKDTWFAIKECYPGSGSDIEMVYKYDEKLADTGAYDVKSWKITPDEHMFDIDSKHRKRPKKKLLGGVGGVFKHLGSSSGSGKDGTNDKQRMLSNDSDNPLGLEEVRRSEDDNNSNDPILPGNGNHQPDSDDDEEASPFESAGAKGTAVNPMKKVLMARSFLGAGAANDSAKDTAASPKTSASYSKVQAADRNVSTASEAGVLLQPMAAGAEDVRRESFFADVFFGSAKQNT